MNIACAIDNNYIRHCAVMLRSLYEANPKEEIAVYIIHGDLDADEKEKLAAYLGKFLHSVNFVQIDPKTLEDFPVYGHLTLSAYYKLLIPTALPADVHKAIFLDCDLIVVDSLVELWNTPLNVYPLATVTDQHIKENCQRLGLPESWGYFNTGVMLIDLDKWRRKDIISEGLKFAKGTQAVLKHCDQDILNHFFEGQWLHLDMRWNASPHLWGLCDIPAEEAAEFKAQNTEARDNPAVIHFAGLGIAKPWNYKCKHPWKNSYLKLKKQTPWAGVPLESQPAPFLVRAWARLVFRLKCLLKDAFMSFSTKQFFKKEKK
ncbi:MAG: hypothetical protein AMJ95_10500 [Omnitrophica WOR_2 bacterium SM23_72]|nr:MAG: hypothetical protein AMJ95_10500 [Omnitrophica WOR_2 bacterium SM23_72]